MMIVYFIVDSVFDLLKFFIEENWIGFILLYVIFDGNEYEDMVIIQVDYIF